MTHLFDSFNKEEVYKFQVRKLNLVRLDYQFDSVSSMLVTEVGGEMCR